MLGPRLRGEDTGQLVLASQKVWNWQGLDKWSGESSRFSGTRRDPGRDRSECALSLRIVRCSR